MKGLKNKVNDKLVRPLLEFLKQGTSPHELALGISLGVAIGLIPVLGISTLICFAVAITLRINVGIIQLVNYFIYPLQLVLILPLIGLGSSLLSIPPIPFSLEQLLDMFRSNIGHAMSQIGLASLGGIFAWVIVVLPVSALLYWFLKKLLMQYLSRTASSGI